MSVEVKREELRRILLENMYTESNIKRGKVQIGVLQQAAQQHGFTANEALREIDELIARGYAKTYSVVMIELTHDGKDYVNSVIRR